MYQDNDYLSHHGVIGMKWGVRRYQNKDGSLTPAGEKRYADREVRQQRKQALRERRTLTDEDINNFIKRLEAEKKLRTLTKEDLNPGRNEVEKILQTVGKTAAVAVGTGVTVAAIKMAMEGKFNPSLHYGIKDWLKEAAKMVVLKKK